MDDSNQATVTPADGLGSSATTSEQHVVGELQYFCIQSACLWTIQTAQTRTCLDLQSFQL